MLHGPSEVAQYPPLPDNGQDECLHPIGKLTRPEKNDDYFLRVPSETVQRRLDLPNEHTYILDTGLYITVCLRSLAKNDLGLVVKYCTKGGEQETKEVRSLKPNSECNLEALILIEGEDDNELHMYDSHARELLTLRFKVKTASVVSSEPSTMALPDNNVKEQLKTYNLEDEIERLASSGIHTYEQLENMTDEHTTKYHLRFTFRGLIAAMKGGEDGQGVSKKRPHDSRIQFERFDMQHLRAR